MDIRELLRTDLMIMDLKAQTKAEVIDEMVRNLFEKGVIKDEEAYKKDIIKREEEGSTGMGDGIAIPHAHNEAVNEPAVMFAKSQAGVDYDSLDGQPAHLFFMIAAPEGGDNTHLQALAALSQVLMNPDVTSALKSADTPEKVQAIFADAVARKEAENKAQEEAEKQADNAPAGDRPYIVAVTACPNGIAHTYMAEENLKKAAEKLGVDIKVETNGSEGVKHLLSDSEIARAKGVVIAADKKVAMTRFNGKQLISKPVTSAIKNPEELIQTILDGKAPAYKAEAGEEESSSASSNDTVWGSIYKQLMNGISHMLPFVIGGGILMAISFIVEQYMGGPFNKAAYVFASGAFANDPHSTAAAGLMAAVMVGGMVPPFATALATVIFPKKFTEQERRAGISNWVLGFSFITEGAIPFATADPGHVIPSCIIGSAVSGALVGLWHVSVPAPHGGFWVTPLASNPLGYILAVAIGTIVAGLILGFWRKDADEK